MIFHFKITNQTQISDLWFSFFPFKNHKHKHKHKLTPWRTRRTKPRKKEKEKKKENEVEWGRVALMAMGEEDERGRGLCDSARSAMARTKQSWESRELGTGDTAELGTAARVGPAVRELAEGEIELRERESRSEGEDWGREAWVLSWCWRN